LDCFKSLVGKLGARSWMPVVRNELGQLAQKTKTHWQRAALNLGDIHARNSSSLRNPEIRSSRAYSVTAIPPTAHGGLDVHVRMGLKNRPTGGLDVHAMTNPCQWVSLRRTKTTCNKNDLRLKRLAIKTTCDTFHATCSRPIRYEPSGPVCQSSV
jgi:hypothetical protein